jgi:hypothetical protein
LGTTYISPVNRVEFLAELKIGVKISNVKTRDLWQYICAEVLFLLNLPMWVVVRQPGICDS